MDTHVHTHEDVCTAIQAKQNREFSLEGEGNSIVDVFSIQV